MKNLFKTGSQTLACEGKKENHLEICQDLLRRLEIEPNSWIITGNESWVYELDPKTKGQSEE